MANARALLCLAFLSLQFGAPLPARAQRDPGAILQELQKLAWQRGPAEGAIGAQAKIRIPEGYAFLDDKGARRFLELMGSPPRDHHYLVSPANLDWFAVFSFDPVGYVKDDGKIDADQLLATLKQGDGPANEERGRLGMAPIHTDGWQVPPHYDAAARRLAWGMRLRDDKGGLRVNYTSRLLGRNGVMRAVLVSSPQSLAQDVLELNRLLAGYEFAAGEKYGEFKPGDRVAEYGLAGLVAGGAAAAKAGLFESLGTFLWVIVGGALVGGWALAKHLLARREAPPLGPGQT